MNEYILPLGTDLRLPIGDWLQEFRFDNTASAKDRLQRFWEPVVTPGFQELAACMLKVEKIGIATVANGFLFGQSPGTTGMRIGERWYLPCRDRHDDVHNVLCGVGLGDNRELAEFLKYFGGLGDDLRYSGRFVYEPPWQFFSDELASEFDFNIEGFDDWRNSLMLYEALDGSVALARVDRAIGWWLPAELRVKPASRSLGEFICDYVRARESLSPFCAYSKRQ